jgi:hypothetical protein
MYMKYFILQYIISCGKSPMQKLKQKHDVDFLLGFCKNLFHVMGTPHSSSKLDNKQFTVMGFCDEN